MTTNRAQFPASLKSDMDRDGYVVLRGFLAQTELARVQRRMDRYIAEVVPRLPATDAFYEEKGRAETLKQLQAIDREVPLFDDAVQGRLSQLAELLLGESVIKKDLQWFNKPPQIGQPTPPHQDGFYFRLVPNEALTFWLALDDVDESNGCVRYIPGSHRTGMRPHGRSNVLGFSQGITDFDDTDHRTEVPVHAKPGDLLVHHSLTIHRAEGNSSARHRRALGQVFYGASAQHDKAGMEQYQRQLHEQLKADGKI
jgi:phytanoyl-CoA hydroxylase